MGVNINSARADSRRGQAAWLRFSLDCRTAEQVAGVIGRIAEGSLILDLRCLDDEAGFVSNLTAIAPTRSP